MQFSLPPPWKGFIQFLVAWKATITAPAKWADSSFTASISFNCRRNDGDGDECDQSKGCHPLSTHVLRVLQLLFYLIITTALLGSPHYLSFRDEAMRLGDARSFAQGDTVMKRCGQDTKAYPLPSQHTYRPEPVPLQIL